MGTFFFILGALIRTHPPHSDASHASGASIAMAVMIYLYGMDFHVVVSLFFLKAKYPEQLYHIAFVSSIITDGHT